MDNAIQEQAGANGRSQTNGRNSKSAGAFRTISEVADELDVAQHVLRFWESKFPQVRPLKRGGGRRYYRPEDVDLLRRIRSLLYEEGYTIKGAQKLLKGARRPTGRQNSKAEGRATIENTAAEADQELDALTSASMEETPQTVTLEPAVKALLINMRDDLSELRDLLRKVTS